MPTPSVVGSARAIFTITLLSAAAEEVRVDWATKDGTALVGRDYEANSGTVTFAPGETSKTVEVFVHGRTVETEDRVFYVLLDPPVNALLADEIGACVIHVDTTGTEPVMTIIIPRGEKGLTGDSAYQIALNNGFVGTEAEWLASLRPSPAEIAPLVAPLINAGDMVVTAEDTEALALPDTDQIKGFVGRIAHMRKTKRAVAPALTAGVNVVPMTALVGDVVNPLLTTGFSVIVWRSGAIATVQWEYLPGTAEIKIYDGLAGDIPVAVHQDLGSGNISPAPVTVGADTKQLRDWLAPINVLVEKTEALEDYTDGLKDGLTPGQGASGIGRATVSVQSMVDLLSAKQDATQTIFMNGYHQGIFALAAPPVSKGAGMFRWAPNVPRSAHNGGSVVSPTVPWTGAQSTLAEFLDATGETEPAATGCFVLISDSLDITQFGSQPVTGVDNAAALAKSLSISTEKKQKLTAPTGVFEYTGTLDMGYPELNFQGAGMRNTVLKCTSVGRAVTIYGDRPNHNQYSYTYDLSDICFEGNAGTTDIILIRINHPNLRNINLREASITGGCALRIQGVVAGNFNHIVCSTNAQPMASRPANGIVLEGDPNLAGTRASCNTFVSMIIEGMIADGVVLKASDQNLFIGGTSENNGGNGATLFAGAQINTFIGVGFENGGYADIFDGGEMNKFINCYANKNVYIDNSSHMSTIEGGYYERIEVGVGASRPTVKGVKVKFFGGTGGLVTNNNPTLAVMDIYDQSIGAYVFPKIAGGAVAVGASPFSYVNSSVREETITITGGAVTALNIMRDGVSQGAVPTPGTYRLLPGDGLYVVHTTAPSMIRMPGGVGTF